MPSFTREPSRRSVFFLPLACLFASETSKFWDKEDPSKWTPAQIAQLTTDSPWAISVNAELKSNDSNMVARDPRSGRTGRQGDNPEIDPSQSLPKIGAVIRWASAEPIRKALHLRLPEDLSAHYIISVSGLPVSPGQDADSKDDGFEALKEHTSLEVKRGEPIQPGVAYQDPDDTSTVYFGFLPALVPVADAKTALFQTNTGPLAAKAKFVLTKMKFHGELAV